MNEAQAVYDPRGVVEAEAKPLAPRVTSLEGLRLGVLDNSKWNAGRLLREAAGLLAEAHGFAAVNHYKKDAFALPAPPELIARIAAESDVVLTAIGD